MNIPFATRAISTSPRPWFSALASRSRLPGLLIVPLGLVLGAPSGAAPGAAPKSPAEEAATFDWADPLLTADLVAAEPDVVSPVAMTWDASGRLFVAEMLDYPVGAASGRIRMLEDKDGDGRYETSTIFADSLSFPNGVMAWSGGVLVTAAPDILFLKDTDNDGKADVRRVLFTGFAEGNQQLRVNGLHWGIDGWIYGANGRSDGEVRGVDGGRPVSIRGSDFRLRPDSGAFELVAGRSQFGLARDDWGNRFLSWNTIPIRHDALPRQYLERNPRLSPSAGLIPLVPPLDEGRVYPRSLPPMTFNQESTSHFNALAGLAVYRGDLLPRAYYGNAFVGESLRNLVHRRALEPQGATFTAKRMERETEFLTAKDPWFHPVNFATGPDGALYIADFYRLWVEHPGFVPEKLRSQHDWREGANHGRIWRVRPKTTVNRALKPSLANAPTTNLVQALQDPNGWRRDTAQRLLAERRDAEARGPLKELLARSPRAEARALALHTLELLDGLDETNLVAGFGDANGNVRAIAVRLSEPRLTNSPFLQKRAMALARDREPRVRLQVALAAGGLSLLDRIDPLYQGSQTTTSDGLMALAIRSSAGDRPWPLLEQILWGERTYQEATEDRLSFFSALAGDVGVVGPEQDRNSLVAMLVNFRSRGLTVKHVALAAGLLDGWAVADPSWHDHLKAQTEADDRKAWLRDMEELARSVALDSQSTDAGRRSALTLLVRDGSDPALAVVRGFLSPASMASLQMETAKVLAEKAPPAALRAVYNDWTTYSTPARRALLGASLKNAETVAVLLEALERKKVASTELDPTTIQGLRQIPVPDLAARAAEILGERLSSDRQKVVDSFASAMTTPGDARRGAQTFAKLCLSCHKLGAKGVAVGPDLSGVASRPREALVVDILDPSRQVAADYVNYGVLTDGGEVITGLIVADLPTGVTLRRPNLPDERIPREKIKALEASGRSLMPDGLEAGMVVGDLSDLLEFLTHPNPSLLP
ncbi:MAG: c-type cytochrome [Verrucomicrobia bacterium]|nr:c-type cytochrome [Verrucomicrobiota bacterium]MBI3869601.1 c-type cytochrome [Verrucomicrobiota bacterium]